MGYFWPPLAAMILLGTLCNMAKSAAPLSRTSKPSTITLGLQTRDKDNKPTVQNAQVEGRRLAVVVMDMWNSHWDPTYTARSAAIVPQMNQFLHNARAAGATVIFSPTVMIDFPGNAVYGGTRQRAAAKVLPDAPLPAHTPFEPAEPQLWLCVETGMDGKPVSPSAYSTWGNDFWPLSAQCPGLDVEEGDYFVGDGERSVQEMWNVMQKHRIEQVLYVGGALNMCLYVKPIGVYYLKQRGISTLVVRGLTEGWSVPRHWYKHQEPFPKELGGFSHQKADDMMVAWYERNVSPSTPCDIFPQAQTIKDLKLQKATAAYSPKGFEAGKAIDYSPQKNHGWGNNGNPAKGNVLVVQLAAGADNQAGDELVFVLDFLAHVKASGMGHFRLSATTDGRSLLADATNGSATAQGKNSTTKEAAAKWVVLQPTSARTLSVDSQIQINPDGSLLVKATQGPDFDRYVVRVKNPLGKKVTGFRLEAMTDGSLPGGGPGLGADGNFLLNDFMVRTLQPAEAGAAKQDRH